MVKKDTKKKIAIGTAAAIAGGAAAMSSPKVREEVSKLGQAAKDKAKDTKEDVQDKLED